MESSKVEKSNRFLFLILFLIGLFSIIITFWYFQSPWYGQNKWNISAIQKTGLIRFHSQSISFEKDEKTIIKLNNKKAGYSFKLSDFNQNPTLSYIPTTLNPNKDKSNFQYTWKEPENYNYNVNYFSFQNKTDSFFVPAVNDFDFLTHGKHAVFLYVDSSDFFSDSIGIFVPGINANPLNIKKYGNYAKRGRNWERKVYYQLFKGNGNLIDQGWIGVRIHGNLSRAAPQKSIKFYGRSVYGKKKFTPPFKDSNKNSRFILRTPFASLGKVVYKDAMISEIAIKLGLDAMRSTPANVYLNGEFWGFYNFRDRIDEDFFFEKYNIDTLDFVELWGTAKHGSNEDYKKLSKWIYKNDLRLSENYESLLKHIDLENYTRYLLLELFFSNRDWPHNNVRYWRSSELDGKWRWIIFDMDATGLKKADMAEYIIERYEKKGSFWPVDMMFGLLANDKFYSQFLSEFSRLNKSTLEINYLKHKADSLKEIYMPLIPNQAKRWYYPGSVDIFEKAHINFLDFLEYRDRVFVDELKKLRNYAIKYQDEKFK